MTEKQKQKKSPSASVALEGNTLSDFTVIKEKIEEQISGVKPTNADVLRHALHLAALFCAKEVQP